MPKLPKEQRKVRDAERFADRVNQCRAEGRDAAAYALANSKARKFLNAEEKVRLNEMLESRHIRSELKANLAIDIAQTMLYALKDGMDPDGEQVKKEIRRLKEQYRQQIQKA